MFNFVFGLNLISLKCSQLSLNKIFNLIDAEDNAKGLIIQIL